VKKTIFALSIVLILASCDNGGMSGESNPFIGAWEADDGSRYTFSKNEAASYYPDGRLYWTGTYTYNDTHILITLEFDEEDRKYGNGTFPFLYNFENDLFILNGLSLHKSK